MNTLIGLSPATLRKAANLQERILELQSKFSQLLGQPLPTMNSRASEDGSTALKPKRKMTAAARAAISAAAKARWKKAKAAGRNRL